MIVITGEGHEGIEQRQIYVFFYILVFIKALSDNQNFYLTQNGFHSPLFYPF